ncbi:S-adenosyl-L-methionine-dependent methyltransferase [Coniophora puteana RWD-64-598 SS2]|uniref:S-adenosyl-L-methionine-dependent methyltransferase n=1 Tax=Coniophora puteana (strain RWD-64-598) TaxID=741705 RepID=A0A5M3MIR8_CONPW|nr:S-adenosyl-L-methionine-dependent methyltransferase [Coniophora puteana RWD-64-598 SS2]EIW79149.1 S-adenosyl-L-methionine-dependent methyltransferase [Coniophora puteana RWD-64-598 SS2]
MALPQNNSEYGTKTYWDLRYREEAPDATFDWFKSYADIADVLRQYIPDKSARILMLGCGNSTLSQDMYDDGFKNIVNIDFSGVLIEKMRSLHAGTRPEMEWHEMDIRDLKFEDGSFDVAIDKGTMDAMMTSVKDVWNPPEHVIEDCSREVSEVVRVLRKKSGIFLYLTFGQPHFRKRHLTMPSCTLEVKELGDSFHYYLYILRT